MHFNSLLPYFIHNRNNPNPATHAGMLTASHNLEKFSIVIQEF